MFSNSGCLRSSPAVFRGLSGSGIRTGVVPERCRRRPGAGQGHAVRPGGRGGIHGAISQADQFQAVAGVGGIQCDADAGTDRAAVPVQRRGRVTDTLGDRHRGGGIGEVSQQDRERVAAAAADDITGAAVPGQAGGDQRQRLVGDLMAAGVVDRLEAVRVQGDERTAAAVAPRLREGRFQSIPALEN